MLNDMHTSQYMTFKEANVDVCVVLFAQSLCYSFNGAAHGGPADSGNHRKDSAGHLPHEARTTQ